MYIILHCRRRSGKWNGCSSRRRTPWEKKINSEDKFRNSPLSAQIWGQRGKCLRWGRHLLMQQMFSSPQHLCMMTIRSGGLECRSFSPQLELLCKWQFIKEIRDNWDPIVPKEKLSSCQLCTIPKSFQKSWKVWPLLCEDISQYSEHPGFWHFDKSCQRLSLLTSTIFASLLSSSSSSPSSSSLPRPSRSSFPPSGSWNSELPWLCVFWVEAREAGCVEPSSSESWRFINQ